MLFFVGGGKTADALQGAEVQLRAHLHLSARVLLPAACEARKGEVGIGAGQQVRSSGGVDVADGSSRRPNLPATHLQLPT